MKRYIGKNGAPFTILESQLDYCSVSYSKHDKFEYKGKEVIVLRDPMVIGSYRDPATQSERMNKQYTVRLFTNDPNECIEEEMDASDVHWLRDGGFMVPNAKHRKGYEWIEKERLEKKFGWFDHGLDFEGLKELNEWYEGLRYKEDD